MQTSVTGAEFKSQLRAGSTKLGLFLNAHSPTVAEQLAHSGYDWLLVDTQHGRWATNASPGCWPASRTAEPRRWCAWAATHAQGSGNRSTWAPMAYWCPASTPRMKRERQSAAAATPRPARARCNSLSAAHEQRRPAWLRRAANDKRDRGAPGETRIASGTWTRLPQSPAWTCCSSVKTICACRWGCTRNKFPDMYITRAWRGDEQAGRRSQEAQHHPRRLPLRHVARCRIHRQGIPVPERRKRSAASSRRPEPTSKTSSISPTGSKSWTRQPSALIP